MKITCSREALLAAIKAAACLDTSTVAIVREDGDFLSLVASNGDVTLRFRSVTAARRRLSGSTRTSSLTS